MRFNSFHIKKHITWNNSNIDIVSKESKQIIVILNKFRINGENTVKCRTLYKTVNLTKKLYA